MEEEKTKPVEEKKEEVKKEEKLEVKVEEKAPVKIEEKKIEEPKVKIEEKKEEGREYIIPLRKFWGKTARYKRANKAVKGVKRFLVRHMKIYDRDLSKIKIDKYLNEFIWARGIKKPPAKIKVRAIKKGDIVMVELAELPDKLKFKKARLEKREKKAAELGVKKKKLVDRLKEGVAKESKPSEKTEEEKKEEKEKQAAVGVAAQAQAKKAAKKTKHETKVSKQPKRQVRQALAK